MVANSDTPRLPTLKEIIGYQTYDYTTTPSSVVLNLLPAIDINENVGSLSRAENEQPRKNVGTLRIKYLNKINVHDANENPLNRDLDRIFEEHDTDTNDIDDESSISKRRKTRIDHGGSSTTTLKPTTMRGTPISSLTARSVTRGFYVTKGDVETTMAIYTAPDYATSTTELSLENDASKDTTESVRTTSPATTTNIVHERTPNDGASSVNSVFSDKPTRGTRGRVRYTDGSTPLYGRRIRGKTRSTTEPNYSNIVISSTSKDMTADTVAPSNKDIYRNTTPVDYTLETEFDTTISETSTPMTTKLETETMQPESSTATVQSTQETKYETDDNEIIADKNDEYLSTVISDNTATTHEITTTRHGLTRPSFETTFETESTEETTLETTTLIQGNLASDVTTEEKSDDVTTATPKIVDTVVSKPSPTVQQTTIFSETTEFLSTSSPNLLSSENPATTQEIKEKPVPRQRQRSNYNFGQRTRTNGHRRVVQRKEIEARTLTQEEGNNLKPNGRHRVAIYRKRQRRPNVTSSSTEASNLVERLKANRKEYDEETIPTEQNPLQDTTPATLVTEEYTERLVDEGTLSKNPGSSPSRTKSGSSILANRLRKVNGSSQSSSLLTRPSTVLGDNRKNRPSETTTVSPTTIVDAFEDATVSSPEQSVKDEDERAEISDQNGRAQELAVTLADPPTSQSSSNTGRLPLRDTLRRRISTTVAPRTDSPRTSSTSSSRLNTVSRNRQRPTSTTRKEVTTRSSTSRPRRPAIIDYDYYEDEDTPIVEKAMYNGKLYLTSKGTIKCLDQGNFPHPYSCKKFITCARIVSGLVVGAEYTCPDKLSFDPVGGICNWSAGLGCKE